MNSWWWTEELSETRRVSCKNKFVILVHLVGFYYKDMTYRHKFGAHSFFKCMISEPYHNPENGSGVDPKQWILWKNEVDLSPRKFYWKLSKWILLRRQIIRLNSTCCPWKNIEDPKNFNWPYVSTWATCFLHSLALYLSSMKYLLMSQTEPHVCVSQISTRRVRKAKKQRS